MENFFPFFKEERNIFFLLIWFCGFNAYYDEWYNWWHSNTISIIYVLYIVHNINTIFIHKHFYQINVKWGKTYWVCESQLFLLRKRMSKKNHSLFKTYRHIQKYNCKSILSYHALRVSPHFFFFLRQRVLFYVLLYLVFEWVLWRGLMEGRWGWLDECGWWWWRRDPLEVGSGGRDPLVDGGVRQVLVEDAQLSLLLTSEKTQIKILVCFTLGRFHLSCMTSIFFVLKFILI